MHKTVEEMISELQSAQKDPSLSKAEYTQVRAVFLRKKKYRRAEIAEIVGKSHSVVED